MAGQSHLNLLDSVGHYLNQGRFNDALTAANTAQRLQKPTNGITDSLSAKIHYWLGKCYLVLADKGQALAHFDTAWACVSNQESDLRYLIELQSGVLKPDKNRIRQAMHYFETTTTFDQQVLGEAYLAYASYLLQTTDNELVIKALHKARTLLQGVASGQSVLGKCIELTGFYWWRKEKEYERALEHFQQAEDIYKKNGGPGSNYLAALYINFGGCLDEMGYPRKAVELYKTAEINLQGQNIRHPLLLNLYNNLGNSLSDLGDFTPAIRYLEKAVELAPNEQKGRYWNNLGDVYIDQGNYAQAEKCFNQSIALFSRLEKPPPAQLARPYHNLAIVYRQRGALDSALQFEFRSLPLRKSDPRAFLDIARTFQGIGECYLAQQNYTSAARYLDSALLLQRRAIPGGRNAEIAGVCLSKARCMAGSGDLDAAMALCDSALIACGYDDGANFEAAIAPPELLSVLAFRGNLFTRYYQKSAQIAHLSAAELAFDTAAQAIRFFRNTLLESESRAVLAGQFRDILSEGVAASLALHRLEPASGIHLQRAFAYAEQSKALVLLEGVRSAGAVRFEGVSDSLLDLERRLRQEVTDAEVRLRKWWSRSGAASDSTIALAKNELFNRQRAFEHFQRSLASGDLARYYEFRYGFSLANPEEVQSQLLHPNKCLVSYFIENNQRVTAFVVQKEAVYAVECPGGQNLHALVDSLRNGLFGYYTLPRRKRTEELYAQTLHQYIPAAQNLYNLLLAPVESLLTEEVVIVPDGILGYVPFELLLTGPPPAQITNFTEYPYWFKSRRHRVSYSYSATLLREMSQKQHRIVPEKSLLAMAPFFPGARTELSQKPADPDQTRKGMNPLVYSGQEVRDIGQICESDNWWVGREATKSLFLREAPHCRLVHLSTHGVLDSAADFSYLGFAPETEGEEPAPLFVRDLYNLQLNADLVTLSACETGIGQLQSGEGIISLARAFAYAGAKSIVTSLWQVNDAATKDLMLLFYQELNRGKNKDQALHDAKLGYLQSTSGERSHPFFWAGLIGLGAMNPVALR
jgi:CHAT domain-containing protein/Tfp pilus assembly protein PilF